MREAIIALEVQGLVEVRIGSGAYVLRQPGSGDVPGFNITAFELTEARLLFEGEAAALAAAQITDAELAEIEVLVRDIASENQKPSGADQNAADRAFHIAIARATRNNAVLETVENLWNLRYTSPEAALLHAKARTANVKPVVDEHTAVLEALRRRDPAAAREIYRELAAKTGPWAQNALFALGQLERELGRRGRARELFQQYLDRFPDGPNAADVRAFLLDLRTTD